MRVLLFIVLITTIALSDWKATDARISDLARKGNWKDALPVAQQLVQEAALEYGPDSPEMATSLNTLGVVYLQLDNRGEAGARLMEALQIREKTLGKEHPVTSLSLYNLGNLAELAQDWPLAQSYFDRCLAIREQKLGPYHDLTRAVVRHLETVHDHLGNRKKAQEYADQLGIQQPVTNPQEYELARRDEDQGRFEEAADHYKKAGGYARTALQLDLTLLRREFRLPQTSERQRLTERVKQDYLTLEKLEPQNPAWPYLLAVVYSSEGNAKEAQQEIDRARQLQLTPRIAEKLANLKVRTTPASLESAGDEFTATDVNTSTEKGIPDWERRARQAEAHGDGSAASRFRSGYATTDDMERYW